MPRLRKHLPSPVPVLSSISHLGGSAGSPGFSCNSFRVNCRPENLVMADSVASRGRGALLLHLGNFDRRGRHSYGVCPDRCLNGAKKILSSDMLKVKLCMPGLNVIEEGRDQEYACARLVATDLQLSGSTVGVYTSNPIRARRKDLACDH